MQPLRTILVGTFERRVALLSASQRLISTVCEADSLEGIELGSGSPPEMAIISWDLDIEAAFRVSEAIAIRYPTCAVLLIGATLDQYRLMGAMQAGVREVLSDPLQLPDAIRRVHAYLSRVKQVQGPVVPAPVEGKVVVVHAPRGGCGKSTLSANLSIALRQAANRPVVVLDLEPQFGSLDMFFNLPVRASLANLASLGDKADEEALETVLVAHKSGVCILPAALSPEESELVTPSTVRWTLEKLKQKGGWTVVDTGSQLSEPILRAMELADRIVVPLTMDMAALRALQQAMRLWAELGIDLRKVEVAGYQQPSEIGAEAIERVLKHPLRHRLGWDPVAALTAINTGEPVILGAAGSSLSRSVRDLARSFIGVIESDLSPAVAAYNPLSQFWRTIRSIHVPTQPA